MRTKRFFLSDIHLGVGRSWDWFQPGQHEVPLLAALEYVAADPATKDVVLLGDIFDTWVTPVDEVPPTVAEVVAAHPRVTAALTACARSVENVFFVAGNHDMGTTAFDLVDVTGVQVIERYHAGLLYAEHGHRFAMFNAPHKMQGGLDKLPLGYFVSRLMAGRDDYTAPGSLACYIDDALETAFTTQRLAESVIEGLMELTGHGPQTIVRMRAPRSDLTLAAVQQKYADLFTWWVQKFGYWYALRAVRAELDSLEWFADREARQQGYRVVVMGHTHSVETDADGPRRAPARIYANTGSFCSGTPTLVEVDKADGHYAVRLHAWDGHGRYVPGNPRTV